MRENVVVDEHQGELRLNCVRDCMVYAYEKKPLEKFYDFVAAVRDYVSSWVTVVCSTL